MNTTDINKSKVFFLLLSFLFIISNIFYTAAEEQPAAVQMKEYLRYLSSDELEGREPGKKGNFEAANFIANNFKKFGLIPLGSDYFQNFSISSGVRITDKNSVSFSVKIEKPGVPLDKIKPIERKWTLKEDFYPISFSDNASFSGEIAFVGYGISAKNFDYDDYKDIDVSGKAVIILIDSAEGRPKIDKFKEYSEIKYKVSNAKSKGATAVILVKDQGDSADVFIPLNMVRFFKSNNIPVVQASRTSISKFFPKDKQLYVVEQEIVKNLKPKSFIIPNTTVNISVDLEIIETSVPNVLGLVKGIDEKLSDEYIVVGAHFDHLGWGGANSLYRGKTTQIHNGADDNASGTSVLLELAERVAKNPLKRSVIFFAINCEEMGLLGSNYYVWNPLVSLEKTVFMLNLDMVGRMQDSKLNIIGTGSSPYFSQLVDSISAIDNLILSKSVDPYGASDHTSFYSNNVPVMFFFTGLHSDYHLPSDDFEKINFDGMLKVADFSMKILDFIGNNSNKPEYILVKMDHQEMAAKAGAGNGAWFGIVPNFEDNHLGFKISGTSTGSPAEKAGLKNGDIITKFGEKVINNLYDLTYAIREHSPGDVVVVELLRDGKLMKFNVELSKRGK